ncbi:taste receptor type 2 member 143 [Pristis pectinata]|uniref:taste receptor type 2 member 143 n=1 Tax=Pristis pectinata TaxID=685728 RepID=UPI00223D7E8E|nr:taste receptor type 2 member 143 [Pristis pectinata]
MGWLMEATTVGFFAIFGLIANVFILLTLLPELRQCNAPPADVIVAGLALANMITIAVAILRMAVDFIHIFCELQQKIAESFLTLSHSLSFWISALLCFFYCLKIVSVHRPNAKKLAQIIGRNSRLWIAATALLSCALGALDCYMTNAALTCQYHNGSYHFHSTNGSNTWNRETIEELDMYMNLILGTAFPTVWMSTSCICLITALLQNRRFSLKLTSNVKQHKDHHMRIIAMVICLYLLFLFILFARIIFLFCVISQTSLCSFMMEELFDFTYLYDAFSYAVLNPVIIVCGVCKLRDKMSRFCCRRVTCPQTEGAGPPFVVGSFAGGRGGKP